MVHSIESPYKVGHQIILDSMHPLEHVKESFLFTQDLSSCPITWALY